MRTAPITLEDWASSPIWEDALREPGRDKEGRFKLWGNTQPFLYTSDLAMDGDLTTGLRHWPNHGDKITIQPPSDAPLNLEIWEVKVRVYEQALTWSSCAKRIRFYVRAEEGKTARRYVEKYFLEAHTAHRSSLKASYEGPRTGYVPDSWTFKTGISPATRLDRLPSGTIPAETKGTLGMLSLTLVLWMHFLRANPDDNTTYFRTFQAALLGYDLCDLSEGIRFARDMASPGRQTSPTSQGAEFLGELAPKFIPERFTPPAQRELFRLTATAT